MSTIKYVSRIKLCNVCIGAYCKYGCILRREWSSTALVVVKAEGGPAKKACLLFIVIVTIKKIYNDENIIIFIHSIRFWKLKILLLEIDLLWDTFVCTWDEGIIRAGEVASITFWHYLIMLCTYVNRRYWELEEAYFVDCGGGTNIFERIFKYNKIRKNHFWFYLEPWISKSETSI